MQLQGAVDLVLTAIIPRPWPWWLTPAAMAMVVDTRGHLMGRLASIVAKLVPTGNKAVIVR